MIIDASAIIAILRDEPEAAFCAKAIDNAHYSAKRIGIITDPANPCLR